MSNPAFRVSPNSLLKYEQETLLFETQIFSYKMDLKTSSGESVIKSPPFILTSKCYEGKEFCIVLNPNHVDKMGTKYLSAYLTLLNPSTVEVLTQFNIDMLTGVNSNDFFSMSTSLVEFSKTSLNFGFLEYIPMYRIPPTGNQLLHFRVTINTFGKENQESDEEKMESSMTQDGSSEKIIMDALIMIGDGAIISVNSGKLSSHSQLLSSHFACEQYNTEPLNLSSITDSKKLMEIVVRFCHSNVLILPNDQEEMAELMRVAKVLEIPELMKKCEDLILKKLSLDTFTSVVELANQECFSRDADAILYKFLLDHFDELELRDDYRESFDSYKSYYGSLLMLEKPNST